MPRIVLLLALALGGCSASGAPYTPQAIEASQAQLVIYRPSSMMLGVRSPDLEINGVVACEMTNAGIFITQMPPSKVTLSASLWDMPGTSRFSFKTEKGKRYYIRISVNRDKVMASAIAAGVGGGIGATSGGWEAAGGAFAGSYGALGVAEAVSEQKGPFLIEPVSETIAQSELLPLRINDRCTN